MGRRLPVSRPAFNDINQPKTDHRNKLKRNCSVGFIIQLPPSLLQPLDADRLRGTQFLREEAHAQLFQ